MSVKSGSQCPVLEIGNCEYYLRAVASARRRATPISALKKLIMIDLKECGREEDEVLK